MDFSLFLFIYNVGEFWGHNTDYYAGQGEICIMSPDFLSASSSPHIPDGIPCRSPHSEARQETASRATELVSAHPLAGGGLVRYGPVLLVLS
jgi:hypothetical protein